MAMEYGKDIDTLMAELSAPKLEQEPPQSVLQPEAEEVETVVGVDEGFSGGEQAEEKEEERIINDLTGLPELIVGVIDIFAATVAQAWTKTDDKSKYNLTENEKEQLVKAWQLYLRNTPDFKMKSETVLILTTLIIYAPRLIMAFQERKEINKRLIAGNER